VPSKNEVLGKPPKWVLRNYPDIIQPHCQELTVMWLLSQYSSQHCGVYTYILAAVELSSSSIIRTIDIVDCVLIIVPIPNA
jgi:hypothetical protein